MDYLDARFMVKDGVGAVFLYLVFMLAAFVFLVIVVIGLPLILLVAFGRELAARRNN